MGEIQDSKKFIDIENVLKMKAPSIFNKLPRFVISYIKKIFHEDEINRDLKAISGYAGVPKFHKYLEITNIQIDARGIDNVPSEGRFIFASNHPFGGADGIMIVSAVGRMFPQTKLMVNDLLMNLPDIEDVFIPMNRFGRNKHDYVDIRNKSFESDAQIIMFPAGLCSRKVKGKIVDLEWKKSIITYAKRYKRDIIPVFIEGKNSNFFYNLALWRTRLGIKTNLEQFYLVDEFYKHKNESFPIYFGKPISYESFTAEKTDLEWANEVKQIAYKLPNK